MRKLISLLIVTVMIAASFSAYAAEATKITFTDVDASTEAGSAIYKLANAGVINGRGDGTFDPNGLLTRAELCKMVNLVFGYTEASTTKFSDVKPTDWFYSYVLVAEKAGYVAGYGDGKFHGLDNLTREQVCVILSRVANLFDIPYTGKIADAVSEWARPAVNKVLANHIMSVDKDNNFRATQNITRAELAVVLANFVKDKAEETTKPEKEENTTPPGGGGGGGGGAGGGGGGGDSTPIDTQKQNAIVSKLRFTISELNSLEFTTKEAAVITIIINTMNKVIRDAERGKKIYVEDYIINNYGSEIEKAQNLYYAMSDQEMTSFESKLLDLDITVVNDLAKLLFGIDNIRDHI